MREIKFKAWSSKLGAMFEDVGFDNTSGSDDEITYLQFTGLKDKNGVEIYEGDIVKAGSKDYRAIVTHGWSRDSEYGWCLNGWVIGATKPNEKDLGIIRDVDRISERYEVIGNIMENPELLK